MTKVCEAERKLAREIQLTDWSTARNLSNRSSGVQIPRDICTRFGRYLYSTKCSWIIKDKTLQIQKYSDSSSFFKFRIQNLRRNDQAGQFLHRIRPIDHFSIYHTSE